MMSRKKELANQFEVLKEFNNKRTPEDVLRQIIRIKKNQLEIMSDERK